MSTQAGLAGVIAGETAIATVGKGHGLSYRGYDIYDLADNALFEEVAFCPYRLLSTFVHLLGSSGSTTASGLGRKENRGFARKKRRIPKGLETRRTEGCETKARLELWLNPTGGVE